MKRTALKRSTKPMRRTAIKAKPMSKRWNTAIGEQPKRRGLRAKSRTNSNRHVDLKFRREYMEANPFCEVAGLFPRWCGWHAIPKAGKPDEGFLVRPGYTFSTDPHHILWGQARRHDIRANLLAICREAHDFCHKFKVDGMVLALEAKRRKGELDWDELNRISRMDVRGWLSTKECVFDFCKVYWHTLIGTGTTQQEE